jgi:hypothetical protein
MIRNYITTAETKFNQDKNLQCILKSFIHRVNKYFIFIFIFKSIKRILRYFNYVINI